MKNIIKKILKIFPENIEEAILHMLRIIFSKKYRYVINTYWKFGQNNRQNIFLSIARFMNINRPINGYYMEFGCNEANTFRMAYRTFRHLFDLQYVAFDSFEGLPEVEGIDKMEVFHKGKLSFAEEKFIKTVKKVGITDKQLIVVKGFYEDSLNEALIQRLNKKKAAVIYVDCDLYTSTVSVLNFIKSFLQPGTIVVFDDWNCFYGDRDRGQKKAFFEFLDENPKLIFEDFVTDGEAKSFIFVKSNDN